MNKGNIEVWREVCAPEYAYYPTSGDSEPMSLEETIELYKMALQSFPDLNWVIPEIIAKGDKVVVRMSITATHSGEWKGIPAIGNKVKNTGIVIWYMKDGKCIATREEEDALGFMQQLGMELKPKETEGKLPKSIHWTEI